MRTFEQITSNGETEFGFIATLRDKILGIIITLIFPSLFVFIIAMNVPYHVSWAPIPLPFLILGLYSIFLVWAVYKMIKSVDFEERYVYYPKTMELEYPVDYKEYAKVNIKDFNSITYILKYEVWARLSGIRKPLGGTVGDISDYTDIHETENLELVYGNKRLTVSKKQDWWANVTGRKDIAQKYRKTAFQGFTGKKPILIEEYAFHPVWEIALTKKTGEQVIIFSKKFSFKSYVEDYEPYILELLQILSRVTGLEVKHEKASLEALKQEYYV